MTMSALDDLMKKDIWELTTVEACVRIAALTGKGATATDAAAELAQLRLQLAHYEIGADEQIEREKTETARIAALEKFRADVLAVDTMNVNVAEKWKYTKMLIDEQKGQ
jgi:hypothetical protein